MRRRRLLTLVVPEPLQLDEAEAISAAVQNARRFGAPLVLGGDVQLPARCGAGWARWGRARAEAFMARRAAAARG